MALMKIIEAHPDVPLVQELPEGKWCHSPGYFAIRYPEPRARKVKQAREDEFTKLWRSRLANMSVEDRAQIAAQLNTEED